VVSLTTWAWVLAVAVACVHPQRRATGDGPARQRVVEEPTRALDTRAVVVTGAATAHGPLWVNANARASTAVWLGGELGVHVGTLRRYPPSVFAFLPHLSLSPSTGIALGWAPFAAVPGESGPIYLDIQRARSSMLFPGAALGTWLADSISVLPPYQSFVRGAIELSSLLYFGLLSALALWACALVLERARA